MVKPHVMIQSSSGPFVTFYRRDLVVQTAVANGRTHLVLEPVAFLRRLG